VLRARLIVGEFRLANGRLAAHIVKMEARKRWIESLDCPGCEKTGYAKLSQAGSFAFVRGETVVSIDDTSQGFRYSRRGNDITFACDSCKVPAN
jgi:hypothetical protein